MAFTALNNQPPPPPPANPVVPIPHPPEIDSAFAGNHELRKRVHAAIDQNPSQSSLFRDISNYVLSQALQPSIEPAAKKRRLEDADGAQNGTASTTAIKPATISATISTGPGGSLVSTATKAFKSYPGVSFSIPQRKKFTLELVDKKDGGIRAIGATGNVEFALAWKDVDQIFCLPVPEKAKKQHNFIVVPVHGDGVNPVPDELKGSLPEPVVWTFEEATGKNVVEGEDPGPGPLAEAIHHCLIQAGTGKEVVFPDANDFASAVPESHRKGETAYHVKAHRGSKEGYLFFTAVGILYGFKKPLAFFDFATVTSISYTAVLRNTFNLVISTPTQEIEFSMLDQDNFAGINEYVQKHGLQDASMAAARRAKKENVNPPDAKAQAGVAAGEEESELRKAERELQDQDLAAAADEDDEEEDDDFDPGSEGESEGSGSGSGSESEDDEGEGGPYDEGETADFDAEDDDADAKMHD